LREHFRKSQNPYNVFGNIGNKAACELIDENKNEQQEPVIIFPNSGIEKKKNFRCKSNQ
jgi:hypothetical protein